mgnify:CR=1 FL=1
MATLKCTSEPTESEQAFNFLTGLQPRVHGEYMRDAINRERAAPGAIPETVSGILDAARMFIPTPSRSATAGEGKQNLVYAALTAKQLKKSCAKCSGLGHWARDCPNPDVIVADAKEDEKKEPAV